MKSQDIAVKFIERIQKDAAIDSKHIALYMGIIYLSLQSKTDLFPIARAELMKLAKISSTGTYHKKMALLHENNYIRYSPSQASDVPTMISVVQL